MDYTLDKLIEIAGDADANGYRQVEITLQDGDTAYAPGTTKKVLRGNGRVYYLIHASGVNGTILDDGVFASYLGVNV